MKQIKKGKRLLAVALSVLLAFGGLPTATLAEGQPVQVTQGLCEHHLEHTAECGYGEGQPCEHEHSEDCYTNEPICGYDEEKETTASDSDAEHTHTQECYALDCPHERGEHNADCGYAEAQPCGYTCELCGKTDNEPEPKPGEGTEQTACTLTEGCTLADGHEGECVTEPGEGEKETACTLTEGCTLADGHEGACVTELPPADNALIKTITSWTFVGDDNLNEGELPLSGVSMEQQADFDIVVSMLPTGLSAVIEGETDPVPVDITDWSCPEYVRDDDDNWPITGEYVFTAELPEGYVCAPLPTVKVLIGGAELYGGTITGNGYSFNPITGHLTISSADGMAEVSKLPDIEKLKIISVEIDDSITVIPEKAFEHCTYLTTITLPANLTEIGSHAFSGCQNLTLDALPDGVQKIYVAAFQFCERITLTSLPSSVNYIEGWAFNGCQSISSLTFTSTDAPTLAQYAFGGTDFPIYVPENGNGYDNDVWANYTDKVISGAALSSLGISSGNLAPQFNRDVTSYTVSVGSDTGTITVTPTFDGSGTITVNGNPVSSGDASDISLAVGNTTISIVVNSVNGDSRTYTVTVTREKASPTLLLTAEPENSLTLPGDVKLTATLSGASDGNAGKSIIFTVGSATYSTKTNASGKATHTITSPSPGTYTFGASFAGDGDNRPASATEISGYTVSRGAQNALSLIGLDNAYIYGDEPFGLSTSGGSGGGAVSYQSSNPSVASVTGDKVTIIKAGTFTITATKAGDANYDETKVTSGTVTVNQATPGISLTATGGTNINDPIVLTAAVSKAGTGTTPTGTVTFNEGDKILAENVILNGSGEATCTVSNLTGGNHTYTVTYSGQSGYYNSASAERTVGVGLANQTGFTVNDPGAKTYGDNEFTMTATGGQSSGGVSYSAPDGNGVLTVAADGKVTITGAGKVTVTATKAGDNDYNPATATLDITVAPRNIANVTVNVTGSRVYTGSQLQPDFVVSDGGIAINTGDYINEYGPNVDAGMGTGSIQLTGQRNYTGTKTVTFDIEKRSLTGAAITLEFVTHTHTNSEIKPAVTSVVVDGITVPAAEFDVGYANNTAVGTATVTVTAKADGNFSGTASTTFEITKSNSSSGGGSSGGGSSSNDSTVTTPKDSYTSTGTQIGQSVSRSDLQRLANAGKSLTIQSGTAAMTFDPAALKAILAAVPATAGNITFAAVPADISAFPDAAALIGTRPAYSFTISYKDSKGSAIPVNVNFPTGSASISLNYTPAEGEVTGSLFIVYVDGKGAVTWLDKSSYTSGKVLADVPHFSVYGVAYKAPVPVFTDITNHWAKADMEFVAARGLLSGTGEKVFSPDAAMTRGMFVTALGRLAGVNPASYQTRSFTDVKTDAYYAAYVEWAAQKNIVKGTGEGLFSPDAPVTREQMAVMMTNYAGQMGYSIPTPLAAVTFADNESISTWAAKEVAAMQRAGIIQGKDGNRFDPQGNATRAEVSAVLRRFVEIVIDPVTAQGWVKNDSGQWLYYKDGKAITGWKQLGNKWYYFDKNGIMAVNTKIDGYEIGPDGARKEE